jgi:anti-sigma B factor antagonist
MPGGGDGARRSSVLAIDASLERSRMVVRVSGELDIDTVARFQAAVQRACEAGHRDVVIDLSGVGFCDVRGLHALVEVHTAVEQRGGTIEFFGTSPYLLRLCTLTGIDKTIRLSGPPQSEESASTSR